MGSDEFVSLCPGRYAWNYDSSFEQVRELYRKAKVAQWDVDGADLPWSADVDPESELVPDRTIPMYGTKFWSKLSDRNKAEIRRAYLSWTLSQFLHGEQGALLATSQLACAVPTIDAKLYASTQVVDEARHVEAYDRYLREKMGQIHPIDSNLRSLLDATLTDSRWDFKYIGMQLVIEGVALASFRYLQGLAKEPLIKAITRQIMRDEARHVAFGVLSLQDTYRGGLTENELKEREEFVFEAAMVIRNRLVGDDLWKSLGVPADEWAARKKELHDQAWIGMTFFMRLVPSLKHVGLLTPRLRARFHELGVLHFEDLPIELPIPENK